jgi:hypothetical protein
VKYDDTVTDEEIDITFMQAKALGAWSITAQGTPETMKRLVPFAEKHQMNVSLTDFTLAAGAPFEALQSECGYRRHHRRERFARRVDSGKPRRDRAAHDKDRRRNKGMNEQFGDGDTPIQDVLRLVKEKKYAFPVFAEYEYLGLGTPSGRITAMHGLHAFRARCT